MDNSIRVLIVNECKVYLELLGSWLNLQEGMEIVGQADDLVSAIRIIEDAKPEVVLLSGGLLQSEHQELMVQVFAKTTTLVAAVDEDEHTVFKTPKLGAKGYLARTAGLPEVVKAIRRVRLGEIWLPRRMLRRFFENEICNGLMEKSSQQPDPLTPREIEVLRVMCKGCTNKQIARQLFISEKTVKSHLRSIYKKLKITRRYEAIWHAAKYRP